MNMKRKINNIDLAIWCCIQTLINSECEEGARILIQENNFSLEYQKRLQDKEGNISRCSRKFLAYRIRCVKMKYKDMMM